MKNLYNNNSSSIQKRNSTRWLLLLLVVAGVMSFSSARKKPVLYVIGDSTVRNGDGTGSNNQWGWGSFLHQFFDTGKLAIQNHAIGGRSTRTFINEGRWERINTSLKRGDYVIMQFGHNDAGPLDDTARARGVLHGVGNESKTIWNPITKKEEVVYTYGWYLRKMISEAKIKGAHPIVCAQIPRNRWKDGKVQRSDSTWSMWAAKVAAAENVPFINLNEIIARKYEAMGVDQVTPLFATDLTHTLQNGAQLNAAIVADAVRKQKPSGLHKFLNKKQTTQLPTL